MSSLMALNNPSTIKEILTVTGNQIAEGIPNATVVLNANPKDYRVVKSLGLSNAVTTGAVTVLTTSSVKDTYVTNVILSHIKNVTADNASTKIAITGVVNAQTIDLAAIALLTLTAQSDTIVLHFRQPIKLDRNTAVSLTGTFTVGAWIRYAGVYGYEVEDYEK